MRSSHPSRSEDIPILNVTVARDGHPKVKRTVAAATPIDLVRVLTEAFDLEHDHVKMLYKGKHVRPEDDTVVFADGSKVTCIISSKSAAEAAGARREAQSFPILGEFAEKERVMYYNKRTGEYVDARITGIDRTIVPNSYTVDLYEDGFDEPPTSVDRETEASRLSKRDEKME